MMGQELPLSNDILLKKAEACLNKHSGGKQFQACSQRIYKV